MLKSLIIIIFVHNNSHYNKIKQKFLPFPSSREGLPISYTNPRFHTPRTLLSSFSCLSPTTSSKNLFCLPKKLFYFLSQTLQGLPSVHGWFTSLCTESPSLLLLTACCPKGQLSSFGGEPAKLKNFPCKLSNICRNKSILYNQQEPTNTSKKGIGNSQLSWKHQQNSNLMLWCCLT